MFLGTPRRWWIAAAVFFVAGLALISGIGNRGTLGAVVGVLLLFLAIGVFAGAPMRYGRGDRPPPEPTVATPLPTAVAEPPRPRANIEARDASEV